MFRRKAIEDCDYFYSGEIGDGNGFRQGAGVGIESAPVEIDENAIALLRRDFKRSDCPYGNVCNCVGRNIHRIEFFRLFANSRLPFIGAGAALFDGLGSRSIGFHAGQNFCASRLIVDGTGTMRVT